MKTPPTPCGDELSPQNFQEKYPSGEVDFDLADADESLLALVMRIIATWSSADASMSSFVVNLTQGDHEAIATMLAAIDNDGARRAALQEVAKLSLSADDYETCFNPVLDYWWEKRRTTRNRYAHSIFAHSPDVPDGLLLIDTRKWVRKAAHIRIHAEGGEVDELILDDIAIAPRNELEAHLRIARRAFRLTALLGATIGPGAEWPEARDALLMELLPYQG